ncbi:hydrogenase maturation nickel metallochaperone HypA [Thiobacillus denitrificans]|uniref:hydrogenase maturation nickel metallochaperone HypA/HybF n=1 Tax=Thiobacillus denitrificans TaxID=36861 RepID=UPI0000463359|nr:hydrogenase maturation nickel metallochaperone HypA [Thiobacillus denitrificans]
MHELSIAQALVEQVEAVIRTHHALRASLIRVRVGPLAGVVPELLAHAFPLAAAGSRMEHAELALVKAPVRVLCERCGAESEAAMNRLLCAECGDWHTRIVSGDELLLESVELETAASPSPAS